MSIRQRQKVEKKHLLHNYFVENIYNIYVIAINTDFKIAYLVSLLVANKSHAKYKRRESEFVTTITIKM